MAGADPTGSFDATSFRSNIIATMQMALPNTQDLQPTFHWVVEDSYATQDPSGRPYNWGATPLDNSPAAIPDIQVTCSYQIGGGSSEGTNLGFENELKAQITLLDAQQQQLIANGGRMPDQVFLAGSKYNVDYYTQEALFDVDIYTVFCTAVDQAT